MKLLCCHPSIVKKYEKMNNYNNIKDLIKLLQEKHNEKLGN